MVGVGFGRIESSSALLLSSWSALIVEVCSQLRDFALMFVGSLAVLLISRSWKIVVIDAQTLHRLTGSLQESISRLPLSEVKVRQAQLLSFADHRCQCCVAVVWLLPRIQNSSSHKLRVVLSGFGAVQRGNPRGRGEKGR